MITQQEIHKYLDAHKELHLEYLEELIRQDTTVVNHGIDGGNEKNGQWIIENSFKKMKMQIDRFCPSDEHLKGYSEASLGHNYKGRENLVGVLKGQGQGRSLLLNGHIDTMPFGLINQWSKHPLTPYRKNGKIFGRGSCDMKAGLAGMLLALESLIDLGFQPDGDIIFESVVDEEGGGNGTISAIDRGYKADLAIVAEPTQLKIMPAHVGWVFYKVTTVGRALHSGLKWRGVNAIDKMIGIINALYALEKVLKTTTSDAFYPSASLNIGTLNGGIAGSVVPDRCTLDFGFHYPIDLQYADGLGENIKELIHDCINRYVQSDDWLRKNKPIIALYQEGSAYQMPNSEPVTDILGEIIESVTKQSTQITASAYGCDARLLQNIGETNTVIFGPGSIERAHGVDEYVEIDQYLDFIKVMALMIRKWTKKNCLQE